MAASFSDSYQLSQSVVFQNRVQSALVTYFGTITNEGGTVLFHKERIRYISMVMGGTNTANLTASVTLFTYVAAADAIALADATQAGTVVLTSANRDAQGALVSDQHISNAIAAQFNQFITIN
jgi:hypothetical protein